MNRGLVTIVTLALLLMAAAVASLGLGAVPIPAGGIFELLLEWGFGGGRSSLSETERVILTQMRLPRVLTACLVGGGLGAAGVGFQGLFRNPLADPYVIGASSGAALGVTLTVVSGIHFTLFGLGAMSLAALAGALLAVMVVYGIGSAGRGVSTLSLLLAGVALSSMINAVVSLLMFMNDQQMVVIFGWLMGSLAGNSWSVVLATAASTFLGGGMLWMLSRPLDAMSLGEEAAASLGLGLLRLRLLVVTAASLATAAAVAAAGIIGFVGLVAPHIARPLVGARHVRLVPASALVGALILVLADDVSRLAVAPSELPVGILTALLGCPFFLFLLKSRGGRWGVRS